MLDHLSADEHTLMLRIDIALMHDVRDELLASLTSPDVSAEIPPQGSGVPMEAVTGYIELLKDTWGVAHWVAERIIAWRHKAQQRGPTTNITITREGRPPIHLEVATDEEITIYVTDGRKR